MDNAIKNDFVMANKKITHRQPQIRLIEKPVSRQMTNDEKRKLAVVIKQLGDLKH